MVHKIANQHTKTRSSFSFLTAVFLATFVSIVVGNAASCLAMNTIETNVLKESHDFKGLAFYYKNLRYYVLKDQALIPVQNTENVTLDQGDLFIASGRYDYLSLKGENATISIKDDSLDITFPDIGSQKNIEHVIRTKNAKKEDGSHFHLISYAHLIRPLAWLSGFVETSLVFIKHSFEVSWGWALCLFTFLLSMAFVPLKIMTNAFQEKVSGIKQHLTPKIDKIKTTYKGEEAHNKIMAEYKKMNISPFYELKPMIGVLIQVPILVAVFNALGEMPQLQGQNFFWIKDLSYPDSIGALHVDIPMMGSQLAILPWFMLFLSIASAFVNNNRKASRTEIRRQFVSILLSSIILFILFYPFPSAMVLFWTLSVLFRTISSVFLKFVMDH